MTRVTKRLSKRSALQKLSFAKMQEAQRLKRLLKKLKQENPLFEEGGGDTKFDHPSEEERSLWPSNSATTQEYKMEGGDGDNEEERMEVECKVKIEVDEDSELVQDPLDFTEMVVSPTATTSGRSGTMVKDSRCSEDAKERKAEMMRIYSTKKKSNSVNYPSTSTRTRVIRPPEYYDGDNGGNHEQVSICLLCFKELSSATSNSSSTNMSSPTGKDADFRTMFVLKKMLEVPSEKLKDYLRRLGNPRKWITFCGQCEVKVEQVMAVQKEINELEIKLRRFQSEMKDTIALNFVKNKKKVECFKGGKSDPLRATKETWCLVAKESRTNPRRDYSKIVEAEVRPSPTLNDSSTSNKDHSHKRKKKRGVHHSSSHTDEVPTFVGDDDDMHSSVDTNTTTLTVEEWLFDKKWLAKLRFNENGALATGGYSCHLCPKLKGMKLEAYVKHILHHNERPYRCSVCDIFLTGNDLELARLPKLVHKKEGVPEDHKCSKDTLVLMKFQVGNFLECGFCNDESFSSKEERRAHEGTVHNETSVPLPYDCSKCSSKFRDYAEWRLHRVLEHPDLAKLGCFYCDEIFAKRTKEGVDVLDFSARVKHITERHGPKTKSIRVDGVECDFCGEIFEAGTQLCDHIWADHGLDKNKCIGCPICFARFPSHRRLTIHYRGGIHSEESKQKFICDICGYETVINLLFLDHKFMKHGIEPEGGRRVLSCQQDSCSFKCVWEKTLKVHMMKEHNAERQFKCETCGKGFLKISQFKDHQLTHTGLKPFQCEICGNSFAVKNYLYIHKRLSHQNRPFASTNKKRPPRRSAGMNLQKRTVGTSQQDTPQDTTNIQADNSQIDLQTTSTPSEWITPPPQLPYPAVDASGNNFGANYFPDLGFSSSSTTQLRN